MPQFCSCGLTAAPWIEDLVIFWLIPDHGLVVWVKVEASTHPCSYMGCAPFFCGGAGAFVQIFSGPILATPPFYFVVLETRIINVFGIEDIHLKRD